MRGFNISISAAAADEDVVWQLNKLWEEGRTSALGLCVALTGPTAESL